MGTLRVYHATNSCNTENILKYGFKESKSTNKKEHWLGHGIYFFEDLYYAVEWAYLSIEKKNRTYKQVTQQCDIIEATIDTDEFQTLDLNTGLGYEIYRSIINKIMPLCNKEEKEKLQNGGDIKIIRIIEKIEQKLGIMLISEFDVVCAIYPKNIYKKNSTKKGDFLVGFQRQICVKNKKAIIKLEIYNDALDKIKRIYNLIEINRREIS